MAFRFAEPLVRVGHGITDFGGAKLFFYDFGTTNAKTTYSDFALSVANANPVLADTNGLFPDIYLDIQADVTLKSETDVIIYGNESVYAPEDGITALLATAVSVADTAGNFTAVNVETVLAEMAAGWLRNNRINTISAIQTFTAAIQMSDQELRRPVLLDYALKHNVVAGGATTTLDMSTGNSFVTTLTESTTIAITNPPATGDYGQLVLKIIQDGAAGAYTVTWPAEVLWPSGTAPTITITNDAIDEVTLRTTDAGAEYRGSYSQAFA